MDKLNRWDENGSVGIGGSTGAVLKKSLARMGDFIDRSLSEVRLKSGEEPLRKRLPIISLVDQITAVAAAEAESKRGTGFTWRLRQTFGSTLTLI